MYYLKVYSIYNMYIFTWNRFQYLHLKDQENTSVKHIVSSRDPEQFTYFNQQLTQLSDNLRGLVSDEGQEQR